MTMRKIFVLCFFMLTVSVQDDDIEFETLPDYYSLLQVDPTAKLQEIKKNFRKLAMKYHPDKNKDEHAQGIFQELSEAYSILSDTEKRKDYDELFLDEEEFAEIYDNVPSSFKFTSSDETDSSSLDESVDSTSGGEESGGSEDKSGDDDVWGDLDDETLYKVLKFLADHDYVITKKTSKVKPDQSQSERQARHRRSSEFDEYEEDQIHYRYQPNGERYKPYGTPYDYKPAGQHSGYTYCRTSVRWEAGIKVTNKSCY